MNIQQLAGTILRKIFVDHINNSLTFETFPNIPEFVNGSFSLTQVSPYVEKGFSQMNELMEYINYSPECRSIRRSIAVDPKYKPYITKAREIAQQEQDSLMEFMNQPDPPKSLWGNLFS